MSAAFSLLAMAFAGFTVWLAVRIVNLRERWAEWLALALLAYPISFGPACWIATRSGIGRGGVEVVYLPLFLCWANGPRPLSNAISWWMHCGDVTKSDEQPTGTGDCILVAPFVRSSSGVTE
jgi:hypothetical protein